MVMNYHRWTIFTCLCLLPLLLAVNGDEEQNNKRDHESFKNSIRGASANRDLATTDELKTYIVVYKQDQFMQAATANASTYSVVNAVGGDVIAE